MKQLVIAMCVAIFGASCSLPKSDIKPVSIYTIQVPTPAISSVTVPAHMVIGVTYVSPILDTNRIIIKPEPNRYDHVANAAWPATTSALIKDLMTRTFLDSKAFRSVSTAPVAGAINYNLNLQIYDFEAVYEAGKKTPAIHVRLTGTLTRLDIHSPTIETTFRVAAVSEAADNTMTAIIEAFESAFQQVALDMQNAVTKEISNQAKTKQRSSSESG
jgi:cholesterol transport system auxiliary component